MKNLDIPFNLSLLSVTERDIVGMQQITSLDTWEGATKNFHPQGLYSTQAFGVVGTEVRSERFAYIDMRMSIFHPLIFKALSKLKSLYPDIIAGKEFAVWDSEASDFKRSNPLEGKTGFEFFIEYFPRIVYETRPSIKRQELIDLVTKYKGNAFLRYFLVIPAGLRDMEVEDGRESSDEINTLYYKLIAISNTINPASAKLSPEAYHSQRMSLQNTANEINELLSSIIDGKKGLVSGKWAARRTFDGTRNVITPMQSVSDYLDQKGIPEFDDSTIGMYQVLKGLRPIAVYLIRHGFLQKVFTNPGQPATLVNSKTWKAEQVALTSLEYDRWLTIEGIEKLITYYAEMSIRDIPIEVGKDKHLLGLIYKGPDKTFKIFSDISELPEGLDKKYVTPLTLTELFYCSIYKRANDYPVIVTRYPVIGAGSLVEARVYVKTTQKSEVRRELGDDWQPLGEEFTAYQFPVTGSAHFNAMSPHPTKLAGLDGDHDGDRQI